MGAQIPQEKGEFLSEGSSGVTSHPMPGAQNGKGSPK